MASFDEEYLNTSVVNTSSIQDGDYDMFLDCLEELYKPKKIDKTKMAKRSKKPPSNGNNNRITGTPKPIELTHSIDSSRISSSEKSQEHSPSRDFSVNQTCMSFSDLSANMTQISEQFSEIFAYFDQDVTSSENNFDDLYAEMTSKLGDSTSDKENFANNLDHPIVPNPLNGYSNTFAKPHAKNTDTKDIQCKSINILETIRKFNEAAKIDEMAQQITPNLVQIPTKRKIERNDRRLSRTFDETNRKPSRPTSWATSTASTVSLHDSDSDNTAIQKPFDCLNTVNVKGRIAFFSDSFTERSSSVTSSMQSASDDDDYQFQRTESIRKFHKNRNFFENYFNDKADKQFQTVPQPLIEKPSNDLKSCKQTDTKSFVACDIDASEKLKAVQTYVQTQYLLERIQRLVVAISHLDEKRLSSMNLNMLKKFLTFIRDCSYTCTEVCYDISENFLTDFEKNVMSAEELLYSALKMAQTQQVPNN